MTKATPITAYTLSESAIIWLIAKE